ncbi:hypothetical protein PIB30_009166 [Stylosanthes scabra]|uniref:RNase H type-1 domain-containing protein n=1 Tax=Stylosanthes scabra TaxID=79078 RepID=A0ABU6Y1N1_9FABA|nr:hypothetical protein [Stylosanthes scabra]
MRSGGDFISNKLRDWLKRILVGKDVLLFDGICWPWRSRNQELRDFNLAGFSCVIRDDKGEWKKGYSESLPYWNIYKCELFAVWRDLILAWECGFKAFILEIDSMDVILALQLGVFMVMISKLIRDPKRRSKIRFSEFFPVPLTPFVSGRRAEEQQLLCESVLLNLGFIREKKRMTFFNVHMYYEGYFGHVEGIMKYKDGEKTIVAGQDGLLRDYVVHSDHDIEGFSKISYIDVRGDEEGEANAGGDQGDGNASVVEGEVGVGDEGAVAGKGDDATASMEELGLGF